MCLHPLCSHPLSSSPQKSTSAPICDLHRRQQVRPPSPAAGATTTPFLACSRCDLHRLQLTPPRSPHLRFLQTAFLLKSDTKVPISPCCIINFRHLLYNLILGESSE